MRAVATLITLVGFLQTAASQEKVTFASSDADLRGGASTMLAAFLFKPKRAGPFPAVILMHGCDGLVEGGKIKALYAQWGLILSREAYVVLMPDSFGSRGHGNLCAQRYSARPVQPGREVQRDAYGALAYLRSRADIRGNSIAIFGQSQGAVAMFFTIAEDARPKDLPAEHDFRAAIALYPACQMFLAREPKWAPRQPLLFLMGDADNFTPAAPCRELLSRIPASGARAIETHFYPNAHHAFDHPNLRLRVLTNVKLPPDGRSPTVGTDHRARADAIERVKQFLASRIK